MHVCVYVCVWIQLSDFDFACPCVWLSHDWLHPRAAFEENGFFFLLLKILLIYSAYAPGITGLGKHILYTHTQWTHTHTGTNTQIHMCILSYGLIWFWDKIKFTRRIMAQFRQIIMSSGSHSDRLRASVLIKEEKKEREIRESKEQSDRGMSFCLPTHFPKLVKVPDSIH